MLNEPFLNDGHGVSSFTTKVLEGAGGGKDRGWRGVPMGAGVIYRQTRPDCNCKSMAGRAGVRSL